MSHFLWFRVAGLCIGFEDVKKFWFMVAGLCMGFVDVTFFVV